MPLAQVTFVSHEPKELNGKNGKFTLHKFKTPDGTSYDTSKSDIANAAYAFAFNTDGSPTNTLLAVTFDAIQNGEYVNNRMTAVTTAGVGAMAPGVLPSGAPVAPATPQPQVPAQVAPAPAATGGAVDFYKQTHPDDAARMTRSVAHQSGLEALSLALKAQELGLVTITGTDEWHEVASWVAKKAVEISGDFGSYIFHGSRSETTAAAPISSGAVGGTAGVAEVVAPAAAVAPTAPVAEPVAQVPADDDIPF